MAQASIVVVTGGASGIGAAVVNRLLQGNTRVVVIDLEEAALRDQQAAFGADRFQYVVGDVSNDSINAKAVEIATSTWGVLDAVVLNAGIMAPIERICDMRTAAVTKIFNVNVVAHISMLSVAIPHLRKSKGRVIFTSSDAGKKLRWKAWGAYGATKAAVDYIIASVNLEEPDITAIGIYPGIVNTPLVNKIMNGQFPGMTTDELKEYLEYLKPRLVDPYQPGSVIANLALTAPASLRGFIGFWNDDRLAGP